MSDPMWEDLGLKERREKYYWYLLPRMKELLPLWGSYTEGDLSDFCGTTMAADFHKIRLIYDYNEMDL